jgi:hypothetical protein
MSNYDLTNIKYLKDSELFSVDKDTVKASGLSVSALLKRTKLLPKKPINVVGEFDWKNRGQDISEVPIIIMREKTLSMTGLASTLKNIYDTAANIIETGSQEGVIEALSDPYATMYQVEDNKGRRSFTYYLPWLLGDGGVIRNVQNEWVDSSGTSTKNSANGGEPSAIEKVAGFVAGVAAGSMSPGWGMESIHTFSKTNLYSINIKFPLYNTVDITSTRRNFDFVNLITYQNLKNRTSMVTYVPPSVYQVETNALGGIYMPIAIIENLKIESIGTVRKIDEIVLGENLLIPEAYMVSITLRELIPQSTNIFEGALGATKIEVTSDRSLLRDINSGVDTSSTFARGLINR